MSSRARLILSIGLLTALAAGTALRASWLTADPPTHATVGIVWHDEGAWVHNARNRALWGAWRTDEWNPVFLTPVFTALEYLSFRTFGVGTWQARMVPMFSGLAAVALIGVGLASAAGARAGVIGALLLATNYVFVMWNRAALMESTMTAFIVASWSAYVLAQRRPVIGLLSGGAVILAWFTKASAAFFVAALLLDAAGTILIARWARLRSWLAVQAPERRAQAAAWWTLAGLVLATVVMAVWFLVPNWSEYQFYNWQISVTRKPAYTLKALIDRASWLPIAHDFFTRMWLVTTIAALGVVTILARWREAIAAERLLILWVLVGLAELVVHDSGNERRYVMFVPALVGLAALVLSRTGPLIPAPSDRPTAARWIALPILLLLSYLVLGSVVRLAFLYQIRPGVRLTAALAVAASALIVWRWRAALGWLRAQRITAAAAAILTTLAIAGDLAQYGQWLRYKTTRNYEASVALGRILPPETLVQGKLANGLSLENRIHPIFVGRGFGNYEDRQRRDDVRYILTYVAPSLGYESQARNPVIRDVLDAYPQHTIVMTFDVAETGGPDRAALIDKFGGAGLTPANGTGRAQN
jgi:4-amino-4-deoxy-L-arabinose transferase-like glycosyltransferase